MSTKAVSKTHRQARGRTPLLLALFGLALLAVPQVGQTAQVDQDVQDSREADSSPVRRHGDLISVFSGDLHVPANEDRRGTLLCIGCDVVVEGRVRDVVVILGDLTISGTVRGQVVGVLSEMTLDGAVVEDQLVNVLGTLWNKNSRIDGQSFNLSLGNWLPGLWPLLYWGRILRLLVIFVILLLLAAIVPDHIRRIGGQAPTRYVAAFFVGLLGYLGYLIVLGLLVATVIGIPIAIVGFYAVKWLGVAAIFHVVGQRLGRSFGREMSLLGSILLIFGIYLALTLAPTPLGLIGLGLSTMLNVVFFLLVEVPAVGLVILARGGGKPREARRAPLGSSPAGALSASPPDPAPTPTLPANDPEP